MKKTLLLAAFGIFSLASFAQTSKTYTDDLVVTINEVSTPAQKSNIDFVNHEDGTCDFILKNFILYSGEDPMPVGNIRLTNVALKEEDGYKSFTVDRSIRIEDGDDPSITWVGPILLGEVPIKMTGKITEDALYCNIDIDMMSTLHQIINVIFGEDITTGISTINVENNKVNVYSINGVLLYKGIERNSLNSSLSPGFYIVDGKKVVIK